MVVELPPVPRVSGGSLPENALSGLCALLQAEIMPEGFVPLEKKRKKE